MCFSCVLYGKLLVPGAVLRSLADEKREVGEKFGVPADSAYSA